MADGMTHRVTAAAIIGGCLLQSESRTGQYSPQPLFGAALAAALGDLPDRLEPAIHPHHRQVYHSLAFAVVVGTAAYKLYKWNPVEEWSKLLRLLLLVGCGSYIIHLALDAFTPRSLPLLGRV